MFHSATETTVCDYDIGELRKYGVQVCFSLALIGFLHFKFGLFPPLAVQSVMNPMNFYNVIENRSIYIKRRKLILFYF